MAADLTKSVVHILEDLTLEVGVKAVTVSTVAVTTPAIVDPDSASVEETVTGVAFGDVVIAVPNVALEAALRYTGAYVHATNSVRFNFASVGANVTGGDVNFTVIVLDRT